MKPLNGNKDMTVLNRPINHHKYVPRYLRTFLMSLFLGALIILINGPKNANAMNIEEVTTPKGIKYWLVEEATTPLIAIQIAFLGGSSQDPDKKEGAAKFLASMMTEGVGELSSTEFQKKLEDLSISLSFTAGQDHMYASVTMLKHRLDEAMELASMALHQPRFDDEDLERVKAQTISSIKFSMNKPDDIAGRKLSETIFAGHLYERDNKGTLDSVDLLAKEDLAKLHQNLFTRSELHISVVGAVSKDVISQKLDELLLDLPAKGDLIEVKPTEPIAGKREHIKLDVPQVTIQFAAPGIKRDDPDYYAAIIANHIFGGGSFSSRIYKQIREKYGLAYSAGTGMMNYDYAPMFYGSTATETKSARKTIDIIEKELADFAENGPTEEELRLTKDYLIGSYPLRFDTSRKIARQLLGLQMHGLDKDFVNKRSEVLENVSLEDVKRAAKRMMGAKPTIITVGQQFDG